MASATLLLPARDRFGAQRLAPDVARALARADRRADQAATGAAGQNARLFDILPRGWPVAAVTRQRDAGDATLAAWLRADPAYVQPDINGARLLAYGEALALTPRECDELLRPLRPLFGDAGFAIDAPTPSRWYLRLPREARLPVFDPPHDALGGDLFEHLPDGPEGRRWRALLSEAQVVLHNHPVNAGRIAAGRPPVNSLWFWGASVLPDHVRTRCATVFSDDEAVQAFALMAKVAATPLPARWNAVDGDSAYDLRHVRDLALLQSNWIEPLIHDLRAGGLAIAHLDFADGTRFTLRDSQRWRFWRRPLHSITA
jgi:hypothetical protein